MADVIYDRLSGLLPEQGLLTKQMPDGSFAPVSMAVPAGAEQVEHWDDDGSGWATRHVAGHYRAAQRGRGVQVITGRLPRLRVLE
jgi:hypothetical protein